MTLGSKAAQNALAQLRGDVDSSATQMLAVSLTATNYVGQYAAGGAINDTNPAHFTAFSPTRVPQIVLGAGGGAVTYTITGTDLSGAVQTEQVAFTVAATKKAVHAYATITSFTSNVDPGGTTDLQAGDTMVSPASRWLIVGTAGAIAMQLEEDAAVATSPSIPTGIQKFAVQRINITNTAASNLALLF